MSKALEYAEQNKVELPKPSYPLIKDSRGNVYCKYPDGSFRRVIGQAGKGKSERSLHRDMCMVARYQTIKPSVNEL